MTQTDETPYALVVDDEPIIRMGACDMLDDAGFRCLEASEVGEALDVLREHAGSVTLLFTDVVVPVGGASCVENWSMYRQHWRRVEGKPWARFAASCIYA